MDFFQKVRFFILVWFFSKMFLVVQFIELFYNMIQDVVDKSFLFFVFKEKISTYQRTTWKKLHGPTWSFLNNNFFKGSNWSVPVEKDRTVGLIKCTLELSGTFLLYIVLTDFASVISYNSCLFMWNFLLSNTILYGMRILIPAFRIKVF